MYINSIFVDLITNFNVFIVYDCMVSILLIYFVFSVYELKHVCDKE